MSVRDFLDDVIGPACFDVYLSKKDGCPTNIPRYWLMCVGYTERGAVLKV